MSATNRRRPKLSRDPFDDCLPRDERALTAAVAKLAAELARYSDDVDDAAERGRRIAAARGPAAKAARAGVKKVAARAGQKAVRAAKQKGTAPAKLDDCRE